MKIKHVVAKEFCLVEPFKFSLRERVIDTIPKGFLLLKPSVAGICGSEMLYFKGEKEKEKLKKRLPMCLLHEGVAQVVETGVGTSLKTGTYVVVNPMLSCKKCFACKNIGENFCQNSRYMAATADGLARTFFVYPEERVIPVPQGIELEVAALTEPISIVLNAFEISKTKKGEALAVIGDGPVGYLAALIASYIGEVPRENLCLIGIIDEKLSLAKDFAISVNSIKERAVMKKLNESLDVVFEATGGGAHRITIHEAIDLLRPGGKCILLGLSRSEVPIEVTRIINKGLIFIGSVRSRINHYIRVLDLLGDSELREKIKRIISKKSFTVKTPEDLEQAFRYADTEEGEAKTKPGRVMVYFP